ncbi:MAG: lycopene cyclase domain-containing protein [Spirosomataceae bacterium]
MEDKYLYLVIDVLTLSFPLIASFYPKHAFYKEWKYLFTSLGLMAVLFIVWDVIFTKIGVWGFNQRYLTGVFVFNLPIEEVLFFFFIPYSSIFIYFSLKYFLKNNPLQKLSMHLHYSLISICIIALILFFDKKYTFYTNLFLLIFLLITWYKRIDISAIIFAYIFVIPFFLLTNGILTGSFIDEPVVWYNNNENLGIRMWTIPVEDLFYGFLLIAGNIVIMEKLKKMY